MLSILQSGGKSMVFDDAERKIRVTAIYRKNCTRIFWPYFDDFLPPRNGVLADVTSAFFFRYRRYFLIA
jgi:hypothetical protein